MAKIGSKGIAAVVLGVAALGVGGVALASGTNSKPVQLIQPADSVSSTTSTTDTTVPPTTTYLGDHHDGDGRDDYDGGSRTSGDGRGGHDDDHVTSANHDDVDDVSAELGGYSTLLERLDRQEAVLE
jgi:hypothetical protein